MEQIEFIVRGHVYKLSREDVIKSLSGITPRPVRKHYVEISGTCYPIKQALAAAVGLEVIDFTSQDAYRIFRRLDFPIRQR
jgi:hypothetical protein